MIYILYQPPLLILTFKKGGKKWKNRQKKSILTKPSMSVLSMCAVVYSV